MIGREVYQVFQLKGVDTLYHANTVTTSCTFLQIGGLASRHFVEAHQLLQTSQYSDADDKRLGIWKNLFADGVDIHARGSIRNNYGPVLFMLPATILLALPQGTETLVTRKNPIHWKTTDNLADRFFMSLKDLFHGYQYGDFGKHLILRNQEGFLPFDGSAIRILLDDPQRPLSRGIDAYSDAVQRLKSAAEESNLVAHITKRQCGPSCRCRSGHIKSYDHVGVDFWF